MTPFIIYSLPRSRSTWLQNFFCCREGITIGHDVAMTCASIDDFCSLFSCGQMTGTVETGAVLGWQVVRQRLPKLRTAVVFRSVDEVDASLQKYGIRARDDLEIRFAMLQELAEQRGVFHCEWQQLSNFTTMKELWQHCTGEAFSPEIQRRWESMCTINIQPDVGEIMRYLSANFSRIDALKAEVAAEVAAMKEAGRWSPLGLN